MRGMCEFRIVSTRWRDNNFDRIACDFRSRSLDKAIKIPSIRVTICAPFGRHWFHSELTQCTEHQEGILNKKVVSRELVWQLGIHRVMFLVFLGIIAIAVQM